MSRFIDVLIRLAIVFVILELSAAFFLLAFVVWFLATQDIWGGMPQ